MRNSGLPYALMNMAMTADGKIATANRAVSSFGSRRDLTHLYELRATADAVICGARTVEINDVKMGPGGRRFEKLRLSQGRERYNLRVIVSGSGSIDPAAAIFRHRFSPLIVVTSRRISPRRRRILAPLVDELLTTEGDEIDFRAVFRHLRQRWNIRRIVCEGGGELNDALFRAGVVQEVHLTICPKIFGGRTGPTIADGKGFPSLAAAQSLRLQDARRIDGELFLVYAVGPQRNSTTS
jgi:riboflavin-specific deaminase-like protein